MITGLTGNGRMLLTVNEHGDWNELFYPYPGQFQHLPGGTGRRFRRGRRQVCVAPPRERL